MKTTEQLASELREHGRSGNRLSLYATTTLLNEAAERLEELQKEVERLNSCVKSEDEVRAIAQETIRPLMKQMIDEAVKPYEDTIKELQERIRRQSQLLSLNNIPRPPKRI